MRRHLPLLLALSLSSAPALASLSLSNPPPGITSAAWAEMYKRADWAARIAAKLAPKANVDCLRGVFLKLLGKTEVGAALDVASGTEPQLATIDPKKADSFSKAMTKNREDSCKDDGPSNGATVEAMAKFVTDKEPEWEIANFGNAKSAAYRDGLQDALSFLKVGAALPAAVGQGSLVPAGFAVPLIRPSAVKVRTPHGLGQESNDGI